MSNREILDQIKKLSSQEQRNLPYEELIKIIEQLSADEIIELSNIIGYPVFTRMCMGTLKHKFVLLQDGAAAIIVNDKNQILLQSRADRNKWGLPGGCQELGETFEETVLREIKEETGLIVDELKLKGKMIIEYPNKIFDFVVFTADKCNGVPQEFEDNTSEWIEISELLKQEKILPNSLILNRFFLRGLLDEKVSFDMKIEVDEFENIISVNYQII